MIKLIKFILNLLGIKTKEGNANMKRELTVNNSTDKDFYIQTNNEIDPYISCFPTAMINAASVIGLKFPTDKERTGGFSQPEDAFNWFIEHDSECIKFYNQPAYKSYVNTKGNHPRELYDVECFAFNRWIGKEVCKIKYGCTIENIVEILNNGGAVVTSGSFCGLGHVVCMVGFKSTIQQVDNVTNPSIINGLTHFIVDDSYGNPHNRYKPTGVNGNDVIWEKDAFLTAINKGSVDNPIYNMIYFEKK